MKTFVTKKENLNSSVEMLGFFPVKYVGSREKIGYGKRKLAEICDGGKGETWKRFEYRQWQNFLNCNSYVCIFFKLYCFPHISRIQLVSYFW